MLFDLEADGLLEHVTQIHSLAIWDDKLYSYADQAGYPSIKEGVAHLQQAKSIGAHNLIGYDAPVLKKVLGVEIDALPIDTLVISRLIYPGEPNSDTPGPLKLRDMKRKDLPADLYGSHKLEAWGYRLGNYKGDFKGPWYKWTKEMQDYCEQDVLVLKTLYDKLMSKDYSERAIRIEHDFAKIIHIQETNGIPFDVTKSKELAKRVDAEINEMRDKLSTSFPPNIKRGKPKTPKVGNKKLGRVKGCDYCPVTFTRFNPGSRPQIINFFKDKYKWKPIVFTDKGNPKVDDEVLRGLPFPEASKLASYLERIKIQGYLSTGKGAWIKLVKNGRIHGRVITNGTPTGRCTHSKPNLTQVPSVRKYLGAECRSLFHAGMGWMIGADASGIELRMLAHYLYRYDGGAYAKKILDGDIHTANQQAAGLQTRDQAKTFIYAYNYGAGDSKLGSIVTGTKDEDENKRIGKELRQSFLSKVKGLKELVSDVKRIAKYKGHLRGLDGRLLLVRSQHRGLNTLLQGAGAVVMKQANINFWHGCTYDCQQALSVHDEVQFITNQEDHTIPIGELFVESIIKAGQDFKLNIPLAGEYKVGKNWGETH